MTDSTVGYTDLSDSSEAGSFLGSLARRAHRFRFLKT